MQIARETAPLVYGQRCYRMWVNSTNRTHTISRTKRQPNKILPFGSIHKLFQINASARDRMFDDTIVFVNFFSAMELEEMKKNRKSFQSLMPRERNSKRADKS